MAEVFAPGVISLPGCIEFCLTLSPDENEAFFAIRKATGQWEIHRAERKDGTSISSAIRKVKTARRAATSSASTPASSRR